MGGIIMRLADFGSSRRGLAAAGLSLAALALAIATPARAADAPKGSAPGRIEFDHPSSVAPNIAVDLPAGLFRDVAGLGDAAIEGVATGLLEGGGAGGDHAEEAKMAAEQLAAIRGVINTVQGAIDEVRVRVYKGESDKGPNGTEVADFYAKKLHDTSWDKIVDAREGSKSASVYLMRDAGALKGVFVIASQGHDLVLANVTCDISPARVKDITQQAVSIGLKFGGDSALKEIVGEMRRQQGKGR
jgi:hypothetical protein